MSLSFNLWVFSKTTKIMSILHCRRKPHCDSGTTASTTLVRNRRSITRARTLPAAERREILLLLPPWIAAVEGWSCNKLRRRRCLLPANEVSVRAMTRRGRPLLTGKAWGSGHAAKWQLSIGTCKSAVCIRIKYKSNRAFTIGIRIKSQIESALYTVPRWSDVVQANRMPCAALQELRVVFASL